MPATPDSEFFVALCTYENMRSPCDDFHSFISLGVRDEHGNVTLLGAFGKTNVLPGEYSNPLGLDTVIQNEWVTVASDINVRYKAWAITWDLYLAFLEHLKTHQRLNEQRFNGMTLDASDLTHYRLAATMLTHDTNGQPTGVARQEIAPATEATASLETHPEFRFNLFNNSCRHTALRFVDTARGVNGHHGKGASSFFFNRPSLHARFQEGRLLQGTNLFILPLPPDAFALSETQRKIAKTLYKRLDAMVMIQENNPQTREKFAGLKALYQDITGMESPDIGGLLETLSNWENENRELINAHRNPGWHFFATATAKMFEELHERFTPAGYHPTQGNQP